MRAATRAAIALCLACATSALAYEVRTHEEFTLRGLNGSAHTARAFADLGFALTDQFTGERRSLTGSRTLSLNVEQWVRAGARDEDDTLSAVFARYRNHFYDPTPGAPNGGGFTGLLPSIGFLSGLPAPDWSIESSVISGQSHSYRDARDYFARAVTLSSKAQRESSFASMLYSLGHVVHTIQDLAQPQHARNDSHAAGSLYEKFTDQAARDALPGYQLPYTGGPQPAFPVARSFWNDMAAFSNLNFVAAGPGKNFRFLAGGWQPSEHYPNPKPLGVTEEVQIGNLPGIDPAIVAWCGQDCLMRFIASKAEHSDLVIPRAATYSIFTPDLSTATAGPWQVALNRYNFMAVHPHLVPRAVSHSVGLFDYFFRGRIDYAPDPSTPGQFLITNLGSEPMRGKFRIYYDAADDSRHQLPILWDTDVILASTGGILAPGASMAVPGINPPGTPAAKVLGEYILVFTGDIGEEKEEPANQIIGAVAAKKITNPYKGALWIAALDANNQLLSLKVDKEGTKVVYGWDISKADQNNPNGVFVQPAPGFNPLTSLYLSGSQPYPVRDKPYVYKQAQYTSTPNEYNISMVTLNEVSTLNRTRTYYGTGLGSVAINRVVWMARSPDEQIGTFEFELVSISPNGRDAFALYTRRFKAPNGQQQVVQGAVPMPTLFSPNSYQQLFGFKPPATLLISPIISDDGLLIQGFGRGVSGGVAHSRIEITLGATPQIVLRDTIFSPTVSGVQSFNPPFVQSGTCSVTVRRIPDGEITTFTSVASSRSGTNVFSSSESTPVYLGNLGGRIATYSIDSVVRSTQTVSESICHAQAGDRDPDLGDRNKYFIVNTGDNHIDRSGSGTFARFSDGSFVINPEPEILTQSFTTVLRGLYPSSSLLCANCSWGESYDGFDPVPPTTVTERLIGPRTVPTQTVERALTDRRADAIYLESLAAGQPSVRKFRGIDLSGKEFVADSSPLGEVFFALSDRSRVIHEPLPGNMAPVELPANAVKLLAAIWL